MTRSMKLNPSSTSQKASHDHHRHNVRARLLKRAAFVRRKVRPLPLCRRNGDNKLTVEASVGVVRRIRPLPLCNSNIKTTSTTLSKVHPRNGSTSSWLLSSRICSQPMKFGKKEDANEMPCKKSSMVHFHDQVSVVHIKSYRDYPKSTRKRMYSSRKERKASIKRNRLEFLADGKDWRKVLEEDAMFKNDKGELFHPVHSLGLSTFQRKRNILHEKFDFCFKKEVRTDVDLVIPGEDEILIGGH